LKDRELHSLFLRISLERSGFAGALQAEVTRMGGEAATAGSTAGAIHRGWVGLKTALSEDTDLAILEEADRGEDAAVKNYIHALRDELPADVKDIIARQLGEVQRAHHIIKELRGKHHGTTSDLPMAGLR